MKRTVLMLIAIFALFTALAGATLAPSPAEAAQDCDPRFCWTQGWVVPAEVFTVSRAPLQFLIVDEWGNAIARLDVPAGPVADFLFAYSAKGMPAIELVTKSVRGGSGKEVWYYAPWLLRSPLCIYPAEGPSGVSCGWREPDPGGKG